MKYIVSIIVILLLIGVGVWWYVDSIDTGFSVLVDTPAPGDVLMMGSTASASWHTYNFRKVNPEWIKNVTIRLTLVPANQTPEEARNSADIPVADDIALTKEGKVSFVVPSGLKPREYVLRLNLYGSGNSVPNQLWGLAYSTNGSFTIK